MYIASWCFPRVTFLLHLSLEHVPAASIALRRSGMARRGDKSVRFFIILLRDFFYSGLNAKEAGILMFRGSINGPAVVIAVLNIPLRFITLRLIFLWRALWRSYPSQERIVAS